MRKTRESRLWSASTLAFFSRVVKSVAGRLPARLAWLRARDMLRQACGAFRGAVLAHVRLSPHNLVRTSTTRRRSPSLHVLVLLWWTDCGVVLVRARVCSCSRVERPRARTWTSRPSPTAWSRCSRTSTKWTRPRCGALQSAQGGHAARCGLLSLASARPRGRGARALRPAGGVTRIASSPERCT